MSNIPKETNVYIALNSCCIFSYLVLFSTVFLMMRKASSEETGSVISAVHLSRALSLSLSPSLSASPVCSLHSPVGHAFTHISIKKGEKLGRKRRTTSFIILMMMMMMTTTKQPERAESMCHGMLWYIEGSTAGSFLLSKVARCQVSIEDSPQDG